MATAGISTYLTVHFLIRGEDTVVVPDLIGRDVVYALEMLTDLGLNTKVKGSEYSASAPKNQILFQDPESGNEIKKGRDIRLVISRGAKSVVLPNLSGMGLQQARIFLEENDLATGQLTYASDEIRLKDEIITQYPLPGAVGLRGDKVNLLLSAGPRLKTIKMIDLKGMGLNQAIEAIEKLNLKTGAVRSTEDQTIADDAVIEHSPAAGFPVATGSSIDFIVNHHRSETAYGQKRGIAFFRYRTSCGFLNQHVRVRIHRKENMVEIFNDFVKPDREIWLVIPQGEPASVFVYVDDELIQTKHFD